MFRNFAMHITTLLCLVSMGFFVMQSALAREITVSERGWVSGETDAFVGQKSFSFNVAGGTTLGGSMPMRAYVTIDGVADTGGSLSVTIDSNPTSTVTVELPSGGDREFSVVIPDTAGLLAHSVAGTYAHTLTVDSGGAGVSVLSIHVTNTYAWDVGGDCPEGLETTIKQKTVQMWLGDNLDVSAQTDLSVDYNLVDNIAGITSPVMSAYAEIVSDYSGAGSVTVAWPDNASSSVTYELSSPGNIKQISLLSPDAALLFQAGGEQSRIVRIMASGVTLSSVSVKFVLTYQYHPRAVNCGGFPAIGDMTSEVLDTRSNDPMFNSIAWRGELGGAGRDVGRVRFQLTSSSCANGAANAPDCNTGSWQWIGGATCASGDWFDVSSSSRPFDIFRSGCSGSLDGKRYYRYRVRLCAIDCVKNWPSTPTVDEVYVSWSP